MTPSPNANNFDFVRLAAASMVVISHSFNLLGADDPFTRMIGQVSLGQLGVYIFFTLSGYLITMSLFRSRDLKTYFLKRSLRIFPALLADILISVFIWGALVTALPLATYFSHPETYLYLKNVALYDIHFTLPGVFETNVFPRYVNGSLWTLPYEFICYIGVAVLFSFGLLGARQRALVIYLLLMTGGLVFFSYGFEQARFPGTTVNFESLFNLASFFGAGTLFYLYGEKIVFRSSVAVTLFVLWAVSFRLGAGLNMSYVCLPYLLFWFVFEAKIRLHNAGKYGDFSYGIYIYSFPVQQTIIYYTNGSLRAWQMILLSFAGTLPLAAFSWFVVEKKAIKLKNILFPAVKAEKPYLTSPPNII